MRRAALVLTAVLFALGTTGTNLGPALVDERPRLVLLLSSRNRNLVGAVPYVDATSFFAIGFARILLAAVALYLVGRWYGDATVRWVERRAGGMPAEVRWIERVVARSQTVAVLVFPGSNVVNALVGHAKMPPRRFASCRSASRPSSPSTGGSAASSRTRSGRRSRGSTGGSGGWSRGSSCSRRSARFAAAERRLTDCRPWHP
jgi:uncharacterized membrane protein YgcG